MCKRIVSLLLALLFFTLPLLSSCRHNTPEIQSSDQNVKDEKPVEEPDADEMPVKDLFGKMSFVADEGKTVSSGCEGGAVLSATDESGLTWTLSVPEGALMDEGVVEISMTPLMEVKNPAIPGKLSGLMLSPDGTVFFEPATLTVSGPGAGKLMLFSGDHDGKGLMLVPSKAKEDTITVQISHFSTAFVTDPMPSENAMDNESKEYIDKFIKNIFPMADKLFLEEINTEVPDIDLSYMDSEDVKAIKKTQKEFLLPEYGFLMGFSMIPIMLNKLGSDSPETVIKAWDYFKRMFDRFFKKMDMFIEEYRGDNEQVFIFLYAGKMLEIASFVLSAFSDNIPSSKLSGYKEFTDMMSNAVEKYDAVSAEWAKQSWKDTLNDLREDHQYKYFMALFYMTCQFPFLTSRISKDDVFKTEEMRGELEDSMAFKLRYEGEFSAATGDGDAVWEFSGEVPMEFYLMYDEAAGKEFLWIGNGECRWTGFEVPRGGVTISPSPEPVYVEMPLGMTPKKYFLFPVLDCLTPDNGILITEDGSVPISNQRMLFIGLFKELLNDKMSFETFLELENGEEELEKELEASFQTAKGSCDLTFMHKPK